MSGTVSNVVELTNREGKVVGGNVLSSEENPKDVDETEKGAAQHSPHDTARRRSARVSCLLCHVSPGLVPDEVRVVTSKRQQDHEIRRRFANCTIFGS